MPHSLFFTKIGHAIHGYHATRIGTPASHGCVRLAPQNAATLFALVGREGMLNTTVVLKGKETANTPSARAHEQPSEVVHDGVFSEKLDTSFSQKIPERVESAVRSEFGPIGMRPSDAVFVPSATSEPKSFLPEWLERERRAQELLVKRMTICRGC
jgi:L,D-transpeptidase catalytic domain